MDVGHFVITVFFFCSYEENVVGFQVYFYFHISFVIYCRLLSVYCKLFLDFLCSLLFCISQLRMFSISLSLESNVPDLDHLSGFVFQKLPRGTLFI